MELKIEDYSVYVSQYTETLVEVDIKRNGEFITGSFTSSILDLSERIKLNIKQNELSEFGYLRFSII